MFSEDFYEFLLDNTLIEIKAGSTRTSFLPIWMVNVDGRVFARSWKKSKNSWFTEFQRSGLGEIKYGQKHVAVKGKKLSRTDPIHAQINSAYLLKYQQPHNLEYAKGITHTSYFDHTLEFFPEGSLE